MSLTPRSRHMITPDETDFNRLPLESPIHQAIRRGTGTNKPDWVCSLSTYGPLAVTENILCLYLDAFFRDRTVP